MKIDEKGRFVKVPLAERFWNKVNKTGICWVWTGARIIKSTHPYGLIWNDAHTQRLRAHRVAWELTNGQKIPAGKHILHSCDNPPCVNPAHLRVGTDADNHRDRIERGRSPRGEHNPMAILTLKQAKDIRKRYPLQKKTGPRSKKDRKIIMAICKKYHIHWGLAYRIAAGKRWKHIN